MMNHKTLDYYMQLPYTIEIFPSEEGGFVAQIKELKGCFTQAETWEELELMLNEVKEGWLESALAHGENIPEPQPSTILV